MATEHFRRANTNSGDRYKYTWCCWLKQANRTQDNNSYIFSQGSMGESQMLDSALFFDGNTYTNRSLRYHWNGNSASIRVDPDFSGTENTGWIHVMVVGDSTENDDRNRLKIYMNGCQMDDFSAGTYQTINTPMDHNKKDQYWHIGLYNNDGDMQVAGNYFDIFNVDGLALTPEHFGYFKAGTGKANIQRSKQTSTPSGGSGESQEWRQGQFKPLAPKTIINNINRMGGFGVNGYYLPCNSATAPGADMHIPDPPQMILKLKGDESQPKCEVKSVTEVRDDPYKDYLVYALPFIKDGLDNGYGDYTHLVKGSGSPATDFLQRFGSTTLSEDPAQIEGGQYGSAMRVLAGTAGSQGFRIDYNDNYNSKFDFGTGDFTIEMWFRWDATQGGSSNYASIFRAYSYAESNGRKGFGGYLQGGSGGQTNIHHWTSDGDLTGNVGQIDQNTVNHHAVCRDGDIIKTFLNGQCICQDAYTGDLDNRGWEIGYSYPWTGWINDFRIYKGIAKYRESFDCPKPFLNKHWSAGEEWRTVSDTPVNNFATLNGANPQSKTTRYEGQLKSLGYSSGWNGETGTMLLEGGKWYWEIGYTDLADNGSYYHGIGYRNMENENSIKYMQGRYWGDSNNEACVLAKNSGLQLFKNSSNSAIYSRTLTGKHVLMAAYDIETGSFYVGVDGTWVGPQGAGYFAPIDNFTAGHPIVPTLTTYTTTYGTAVNFGQNPKMNGQQLTGPRYSDVNGKGSFVHRPPDGFLAMCTDNLPEPAIPDPSKYFMSLTWEGDGTKGRKINGTGFKPDLVFIKPRNFNDNGLLFDSVRGADHYLYVNGDIADGNDKGTERFMSFDDNGFTVGTWNNANDPNDTYVGWCWKAGGALGIPGSSERRKYMVDGKGSDSHVEMVMDKGSKLPTAVSVNTKAGLSIVTYAGTGATQSLSHGLGKKPKMMIIKRTTDVQNWGVYHSYTGNTKVTLLNSNASTTSADSIYWADTSPTDQIFTVGSHATMNASSKDYIAYLFADVPGYQKIGVYRGSQLTNHSSPFVYTGFKPAWVMVKNTNRQSNWVIYDNGREPGMLKRQKLYADTATQENVSNPTGDGASSNRFEFYANGFKPISDNSWTNYSNEMFIFLAVAESPFKYATGVA